MTERAHVLIVRDGLILVLKQADGHRWWELPGGEVEAGESAIDAAMRETLEETGIRIDAPELLRTWSYTNTRGDHVGCHEFVALGPDGDVRLSDEHTEYAWMPVSACAERYCSEKLGDGLPEYAVFLAEMRTNCELAARWIAASRNDVATL